MLSLSPTTGEVPSVSAGSVDATGCITRDRECCVAELPLRVRNCSSFVVYRLEPTPGCNMGYCVGDGVPCPKGLNSESGYTPCECKPLICPFDSRTAIRTFAQLLVPKHNVSKGGAKTKCTSSQILLVV